jgi:Co/Zn/Cd efflux system component
MLDLLRSLLYFVAVHPRWAYGLGLLAALIEAIAKNRQGGAHMRANWIFSTNDVIANVGVILAGALVAWTGSHFPDLVVGAIIALVVLSGAIRILRSSRMPAPDS